MNSTLPRGSKTGVRSPSSRFAVKDELDLKFESKNSQGRIRPTVRPSDPPLGEDLRSEPSRPQKLSSRIEKKVYSFSFPRSRGRAGAARQRESGC